MFIERLMAGAASVMAMALAAVAGEAQVRRLALIAHFWAAHINAAAAWSN